VRRCQGWIFGAPHGPLDVVRGAVLLESCGVPGEDDLGDGCVIHMADLRHVVRQQILVLRRIEQCEGCFIPDLFREGRGSGLEEAREELELPAESRMLPAQPADFLAEHGGSAGEGGECSCPEQPATALDKANEIDPSRAA